MKVKMLQVGPIGTNCYILEVEGTQLAAVIDPGDEADRILEVLKEAQVKVEYILLTHGHYDHTTGVPELHEALPEAKIYIHEADAHGAGSHLFPLAGQVDELLLYDEGCDLTALYAAADALRKEGSVMLQKEIPSKAAYRRLCRFENGEVKAL